VLVGGYPFNREQELWRTVGADGFAADADAAILWASDRYAARGS
jgi:methanogenic corrinoid protein MtbC1